MLIISSQLEATLLAHTSVKNMACQTCRNINIIDPYGCQKYLADQTMVTHLYRRPSHLQLLEGTGVNCVVAYHHKSRASICRTCMRGVLGTDTNHHKISKTSLMIYTPQAALKSFLYRSQTYCSVTIGIGVSGSKRFPMNFVQST